MPGASLPRIPGRHRGRYAAQPGQGFTTATRTPSQGGGMLQCSPRRRTLPWASGSHSNIMKQLLNLLAAVALLVWGTHMVRTGVLRVFGAKLRTLQARSLGNRFTAALSGIGVTALVQSSTATSLMTASFVGQGLISLPAALAVIRGADI